MKQTFSFAPISDAELKEQKQTREYQDSLNLVIGRAQECLKSDMFRKYREEYSRQERLIMDSFIALNIADPVEYACVCRTIAAKLAVLRDLLKMVKSDAEKR
jgi:hypothetical protein